MALADSDRRAIMSAVAGAVTAALDRHRLDCPMAKAEAKFERVLIDLYNGDDGKSGMVAEFRAYLQAEETLREDHQRREQDRREDAEDQHRITIAEIQRVGNRVARKSLVWNIAGVMVGLASLCIAVLAIIVAVKIAHGASIQKIFVSGDHPRVYADSSLPQSAEKRW